ncbi:MAG: glycosyltransferase family 4 protein [Mastigocoleus sp.]
MKILIIANYKLDQILSVNKFTDLLATNIINFGHQVRVIYPKPYFNCFPQIPSYIKKWLGYIDKFLLFPLQLNKALSWADIVHVCDHGNAIYTKYLQKIPHIVTCHDLSAIRSGLGEFPENRIGKMSRLLHRMIMQGLNNSYKVICVSEQTKSDLVRLSTLDESAISVIHMGLNYPYSPMEFTDSQPIIQKLGISSNCNYILHVGANHWYKNRLGVLSIFHQLLLKLKLTNSELTKLNLVMVGESMTDEMRDFIKTHNLTQRVIELVGVENKELQALYSRATALLFPSLQEGFGWPIIEAQACGCPVFTSNISPMNYIGGDAAIYINHLNHQEAAEQIIYNLPNLKILKSKSISNAQKFTSEKMIFNYIQAYQEVFEMRNKY